MKLKYQNNWEFDIYTVGDRPLLTLGKVRIDKKEYDVTSREVTVPYSDMGHLYTARSTHYFVKTKVLGSMVEIDLNTVKADITVLVYTVE